MRYVYEVWDTVNQEFYGSYDYESEAIEARDYFINTYPVVPEFMKIERAVDIIGD